MTSVPIEGNNPAGPVPAESYKVSFHGEGFAFFKMKFVQALLIIVTAGIYWAWARAATIKYVYSNTEFAGSRFAFHGTGKEMFIGMLKALGIFGIFIIMFMIAGLIKNQAVSVLLVLCAYAGITMLVPLALYGTMRYRFSRTTWRGIRFGFAGTLKELYMIFLKGIGLSIITLGFYGPFFQVRLRKFIVDNVKFGGVRLQFTGKGSDFFGIMIKGVLLTMLTLGIYSFWFTAERFNFIWGTIDVEQGSKRAQFNATMTGGKFFGFAVPAMLLVVVTLGLGLPWVMMRSIRFFTDNMEIAGDFDPDALVQGAKDKIGAAGEELGSILDVDSGMMFG